MSRFSNVLGSSPGSWSLPESKGFQAPTEFCPKRLFFFLGGKSCWNKQTQNNSTNRRGWKKYEVICNKMVPNKWITAEVRHLHHLRSQLLLTIDTKTSYTRETMSGIFSAGSLFLPRFERGETGERETRRREREVNEFWPCACLRVFREKNVERKRVFKHARRCVKL